MVQMHACHASAHVADARRAKEHARELGSHVYIGHAALSVNERYRSRHACCRCKSRRCHCGQHVCAVHHDNHSTVRVLLNSYSERRVGRWSKVARRSNDTHCTSLNSQ